MEPERGAPIVFFLFALSGFVWGIVVGICIGLWLS